MPTLRPPERRTAAPNGVEPVSSLSWRVVEDEARSGAWNMAMDHALASTLPEGEAVLRLYSWSRPTVSFGRNEPVRGRYSRAEAEARGVDLVRRPTGGRAVLHDRELTYAVLAPIWSLGGARAAYRSINRALAAALRSFGADVAVSEAGSVLALESGPCFQSPTPGEVVAGGRKLVGSAQARIGSALLQHGSIILSGDQSMLTELHNGGTVEEAPATLEGEVGPVAASDVAEAVASALRGEFPGQWSRAGYREEELAEADRLGEQRYGEADWTWRR